MDIIEVEIDKLENNPLSVNKEDSFVFERLKKELSKWGILELPVVLQDGDRLRIISGHHRVRAWKALGHKTVKVVKITKSLDKEEEFNLVNNLNLVRGEISRSEIIKKVRQLKLNPEKLDLFKFPVTQLFPRLNAEDIVEKDNEQQRLAKINELTLKIAKEIAKTMVEEKDELVTFIVVKDKACAVLRIPFKSGKIAREKAEHIKKIIQKAIISEVNTDGQKN
ncbi:ParB N-terminal domain-containing protein [Pseudothermotoga sp.]|uniref:ParB N-terminal domain-containing protein n=1 Tax=Pseudothermotoga sp. TaxID=2033661 RepID=UPI000E815B07|nr:ParB N-terminal domain-containing protein [Pseudothermotoga sp.]HBJ80732.1 hypothetical protein [Pseudothermotoga sp.]